MKVITTHHRVWDFILAALGTYVLSFGLAILGGVTGAHSVSSADFAALGLAIMGMLIGYVAGIVLGLICIKHLLHQTGSLTWGIIALAVWTGISIAIAAIFNLASDASSAVVVACFLSTPIAALLGYYWRNPAETVS